MKNGTKITPRQAQVVRLVAEGKADKQIAAELRISPETVAYHLRKLYKKYEVCCRAALVSKAGAIPDDGRLAYYTNV